MIHSKTESAFSSFQHVCVCVCMEIVSESTAREHAPYEEKKKV